MDRTRHVKSVRRRAHRGGTSMKPLLLRMSCTDKTTIGALVTLRDTPSSSKEPLVHPNTANPEKGRLLTSTFRHVQGCARHLTNLESKALLTYSFTSFFLPQLQLGIVDYSSVENLSNKLFCLHAECSVGARVV